MTATNISFTNQELIEFQELYLENFDEEINNKEASKLASAFVQMLLALTEGEVLEVWYKNTTLVTNNIIPLKP